MSHKRKGNKCLNCGTEFVEDVNFCPVCGQENDNRNVSIWVLFAEFIEENLGVDSKLLRSLVPFLLQPGKLTNAFIAGQRKLYVPPLRMYLVVSLVYFLCVNFVVDSVKEAIRKDLGDSTDSTIQNSINKKNTKDELTFSMGNLGDSLKKLPPKKRINLDKSGHTKLTIFDFKDTNQTDSALCIQLGMEPDGLNRKIVHQGRRFAKDKNGAIDALVAFASENSSLAGLFVLPLMAFWLKLLNLRKRFHFIGHLIHQLHLQSFFYLVISIGMLIELYLFQDANHPVNEWYDSFSLIAIILYFFFSFKRVYADSVLKTIFKSIIYWTLFSISVFAVVLIFLFISFILF